MRLLRCLFAVTLVCGLLGVAKADQLDFHMVVLDPFETFPIQQVPFNFSFTACTLGQLPTNTVGHYDGCFSGVNRTGSDWVGLQLGFSNTAHLHNQPAGCQLDGAQDYFKNTSCILTPDKSEYDLNFAGGVIPNNGSFVIAESGVAPSDFPLVSATVTSLTPEPSSIWLLSTGILVTGVFLRAKVSRFPQASISS